MKNFLDDVLDELHENGIFFVLFLLIFGFPVLIIECFCSVIISPFFFFNEWSKTWFKGDSQ